MCFSASASLGSFLLLSGCCLFIYLRNYPLSQPFSLIFFTVGLMQLAEFFMWRDLNCGWMNHYATKLAFITLLLQPIIYVFSIYYYGLSKLSSIFMKYSFIFYALFFGFFIIWTVLFREKKLCSFPNKNSGHLIWDIYSIINDFPNFVKYVVFPFFYFLSILFFLTFKKFSVGLSYFLLLFFTLLLSMRIYAHKNASTSWKSLWCFLVNIIPVLFIIYSEINKSLQKRKKANKNQKIN